MKRVFLNFYMVIIATILVLQFCFIPLMNHALLSILDDSIQKYYRELTRGVFYVMFEDFNTLAQDQWPRKVAQWQPHFGFPIQLVPLSESTELIEEDRQTLRDGLITIHGDGDSFYKRIGMSQYALKLGPTGDLSNHQSLNRKITVIAVLSSIAFLSILALVWSVPFWRKLMKIRGAAQAFGRGDFGIRAKVGRHSALAPVAEAFNSMAERIERLIDSHRELTRAVSHELRTPVSRIRFSLEMLVGADGGNKKSRFYADGIQKDIDELDTLISEMLTYARFDENPQRLALQTYPLIPWLKEVVAYAGPELEAFDFQLNTRFNDNNLEASFDPKHMGRAISNLLRNAGKYATRRIELTAEQHGSQICLHVDDDGPGIPEEERERIFEPFARLDNSRSRDSGGYGLGLAIVKRVAACHNGGVKAETSPLGGARFSLRWPGVPDADK